MSKFAIAATVCSISLNACGFVLVGQKIIIIIIIQRLALHIWLKMITSSALDSMWSSPKVKVKVERLAFCFSNSILIQWFNAILLHHSFVQEKD